MTFVLYVEGRRFNDDEWKRYEYRSHHASAKLPQFIEGTLQFFQHEPDPPVVIGLHNTDPSATEPKAKPK